MNGKDDVPATAATPGQDAGPLPLSPHLDGLSLAPRPALAGLEPRTFAGFEQIVGQPPGARPPVASGSVRSALASFGGSAIVGVFFLGAVCRTTHHAGVPRSYRLERERQVEAARVELDRSSEARVRASGPDAGPRPEGTSSERPGDAASDPPAAPEPFEAPDAAAGQGGGP